MDAGVLLLNASAALGLVSTRSTTDKGRAESCM